MDLPNVDTVLMLRPTESRILWLQQLGRGLRYRPGKTLRVVDYIGNHRVFLVKTRALLSLGEGDRAVAYALDQLEAGTLELPPGCSVTYELEAMEILRSLIRPMARVDALREYYEEFRDRLDARPQAVEAFQDGYDPASARPAYGSWLGFVHGMGGLTPEQQRARELFGGFLQQLEVTPMTRSYKMLVLLALLGEDAFPGRIGIERLAERFAELARRYSVTRNEVGPALDDPVELRRLIETNPIAAWIGGAGTGGTSYFTYRNGELATTLSVPPEFREALQDLVWEIADWRLVRYVSRTTPGGGADRFVCRVSHAGGRPILFLPEREKHPGIPGGRGAAPRQLRQDRAQRGDADGVGRERPEGWQDILPEILRRWFGPDAGLPGRSDFVVFERRGAEYVMRPADRTEDEPG